MANSVDVDGAPTRPLPPIPKTRYEPELPGIPEEDNPVAPDAGAGGFQFPIEIPPLIPHPQSRNWLMWSVWDGDLMQSPYFTTDGDGIGAGGVPFDYQELQKRFKRVDDDFISPSVDQNFTVVQVTQAPPIYSSSFRQLELQAKIILEEDDSTLHLLACGGLANILAATVKPSDVLIISGGNTFLNRRGRLFLALNLNTEGSLRICRVSTCPREKNEKIFLMERIQPLDEEGRFKFSYFAEGGPRRWSVDRLGSFKFVDLRHDEDFQMPILKDADPREVHKLLLSSSSLPPPLSIKLFSSRFWIMLFLIWVVLIDQVEYIDVSGSGSSVVRNCDPDWRWEWKALPKMDPDPQPESNSNPNRRPAAFEIENREKNDMSKQKMWKFKFSLDFVFTEWQRSEQFYKNYAEGRDLVIWLEENVAWWENHAGFIKEWVEGWRADRNC